MKRIAVIGIVLALMGGLVVWWFSPVQTLKRRTGSLLHTLTLKPGSAKTSRQMGAYAFDALLADEVVLESTALAEANGTLDRVEMASAYAWLCEQATQTRFDLEKFHSIEVDGDRAVVVFALKALVELPASRPVDGRFVVTYQWQRGAKGWQLMRASWVEAGP